VRVAFLTVGDTSRRTGGYLYHARLFEGLRSRGVHVLEIVACVDVSPAAQQSAVESLADRLDDILSADVIVIDALARIACAPWVDCWRSERPLVTLVHELPSVASGGGSDAAGVPDAEARILAADALIAVSNHGRAILEARGIDPARISVVSPGCDRLAPGVPRSLPSGPLRVLCVAQWIPRKGIDTLVHAWNLLGPTSATLELIGETDADPAYAASVHEAISAGHGAIIVSGAVADAHLQASYASASLFALPSRYEGYGMVYAEALLHGLPVVACDVGPVPEVIGPGAGLLVPPGDPPALAAALSRLLDDSALRERLADGALRRGRELPTWDDTVLGVLDILSSVSRQRGEMA
jgi:glycosyltransferase involved in cell wall biosynthesis